MTVQEIMTKNPTCCTPDTKLDEVARLMADCDCGAIPIVRSMITRMPIGIITDRDIVLRVLARGEDCLDLSVEAAMTTATVTVQDVTDLRDAEMLMKERQIRRIIVVDDEGRCVGMLSQADIARHRSDRETGDVVEEISEPAVVSEGDAPGAGLARKSETRRRQSASGAASKQS